ncbi:MAG TPA: restriction endonuclease subunit S [Gemmatales bacterium]|nr:restriction endonuclease subunit S [Gemmatales bacterium]
MSDELPEGWCVAELPATCEINPPKPRPDALAPDAEVTFVPMPAVDAEQGAITRPINRRFSEVRKGFTAFCNEDVIIAKITPCMENGKAAVARRLTNGLGFGSTEFHVLRSNGAIVPEYAFYFIRQESFRRKAEREMTGSVGQKRVPASFLESVEVPLPPLAEQRRIVAQVEALLARVNAARQRLAKAPALLKRFRQSVLAAACSGRLTAGWRGHEQEWRAAPLREAVVALDQGWSPKCELEPSSSPAVWAVMKTTAIQPLDFWEHENKRLPDGLNPREDLQLKAGDLLITRAGPRVRAGVACFVESVRPRLMLCDKAYRFRVQERTVHPKFVAFALNAPAMLETLDSLKTGTSDSGTNLTQQKFLDLELDFPPLAEQHEIVRRVEALFKLADAIEKRVAAATARADKLTQAILAKAFRGELVPTEADLARREGRDYEPASVLLERIKAERSQTEATPKRGRQPRARPRAKRIN